jgi:hypothetical protein
MPIHDLFVCSRRETYCVAAYLYCVAQLPEGNAGSFMCWSGLSFSTCVSFKCRGSFQQRTWFIMQRPFACLLQQLAGLGYWFVHTSVARAYAPGFGLCCRTSLLL